MQRRGTYLTLGLVFFLLLLAGYIAATKSAVLGLDLRGGAQAIIQVVPKDKSQSLTEANVIEAENVIRSRVDALGVSEPEVRREGTDTISVSVAGEKNPDRIFNIVGETGDLYFLDTANALTPGVSRSVIGGQYVAKPNAYSLLAPLQKGKTDADFSGYYAFRKGSGSPLNVSAVAQKSDLFSVEQVARVPRSQLVILGVPKGKLAVRCATGGSCPDQSQTGKVGWYLFDLPASKAETLTGADLSSARADFEPSGAPIVSMSFNGHGSKLFGQITKRLAQEGKTAYQTNPAAYGNDPQNSDRVFAIVLDGRLASQASIDWQRLPDGIQGGNAQISGVSLAESKSIATVLNSGSLKVTLLPKAQNVVSATLGKASLKEGLIAGGIGLAVVMLYMILVYRFLGLIADIALLIYSLLFYGLIVQIPVTMTLPGIAGMILTIGVAADANVVIFERIKEEVRVGKPVRLAISHGYTKGISTIIDANVVTLITAGILFLVSQATVKGFALLLALGVIVSMFTAVAATRAMLSVLSNFHWFNSAAFMGATARPVRWRFDFMGRTRVWFAISGLVILIGLGSLVGRGLNQGIDFKGGTQITYALAKGQKTSVTSIQSTIRPVDQEFARVVRGVGSSSATSFNEFQLAGRATDTLTLNRIQGALLQRFPGSEVQSREAVSASFGSEIRNAALYALVFSVLAIIGYVALRFDWKYAVPMIVALAHDIVITVGIYSVTGREVTASTVAAVLTIMGYSLYDTIIIFDRVRENERGLRKHRFSQILNISLWETTTRSLTTSLLTLLPIVALFAFGGATLKDFAFALIIGIASGAYSSFFIAAPLLMLLKNREPEFARRPGSNTMPQVFLRDSYGLELPADEVEEELARHAPTPKGTRPPSRKSSRRPQKAAKPKGIEAGTTAGATSVLEPPADFEPGRGELAEDPFDEEPGTDGVDPGAGLPGAPPPDERVDEPPLGDDLGDSDPVDPQELEPAPPVAPPPVLDVSDEVSRRMEEARRRREERRSRR